jgi:hypothetical protein
MMIRCLLRVLKTQMQRQQQIIIEYLFYVTATDGHVQSDVKYDESEL